MSNWFQKNATFTIISHTLVVATATWVVSSFIIDENKVNLYKAKAENAEAISKQYQAKISVLELELEKLRTENKKYLTWLIQDPKSLPSLEQKIQQLEKQLKVKDSYTKPSSTLELPKGGIITVPYENSKEFSKGESFIDPKTKATIGISHLSSKYTATGVVHVPGEESIEIEDAKPGTTWEFKKNGNNYIMTLETVNWLTNTVKASVVEIKNENKPNK